MTTEQHNSRETGHTCDASDIAGRMQNYLSDIAMLQNLTCTMVLVVQYQI